MPVISGPAVQRFLRRWWLVGLALIPVLYIRIRLLNVPLERDEGDHAYAAQLMLQGFPPWKYAYNMKFPGTDGMYALWLALFGQTTAAIHLGLLIANAITIVLIALLGRRLFGHIGGAVAGAAYAVLSIGPGILPIAAHATQYVMLFAVAGVLLLLKAVESPAWKRFFLTGVLFGFALLMKQPGAAFGAFAGLYLAWRAWRRRAGLAESAKTLVVFGLGLALPLGLVCLGLWSAGLLGRFWFWTVILAREFSSLLPFPEPLYNLRDVLPAVVDSNWLLWIVAVVGLAVSAASRSTRGPAFFVTAFFGFSFLATSAGGLFTRHYFVFLLPAVALGVGAGISVLAHSLQAIAGRWSVAAALALFAAVCIYPILDQRQYLFVMTPVEACREAYGLNPFPEAIEVARYIASHSKQDAQIAVLGSESEICFYARRRSASGFLFTYSLTEPSRFAQSLQGQMIGEIEGARPEFVVLVSIDVSWFWMEEADMNAPVFYWAGNFLRDKYQLVGIADIGPDSTTYRWDAAARNYRPQSPLHLTVFRRK